MIIDAILWSFLAAELIEAEAGEPFPSPPRVPAFATATVRPAKRGAAS